MNEEILEFETIDEVYEILRKNLQDSHNSLIDTVNDIKENEANPLLILDNILNFSMITYHTLDAMLQIQLGIIKNNENQQYGG